MRSFTVIEAGVQHGGSEAILDRDRLDRAALEQQFERILAIQGPALTRLAASYTNTLSDRDDLLQEIAFAIWQALPRFRGECSERTFAFRIAHNRGITYLTRTHAQPVDPIEEMDVHDPAPCPEANLSHRQRAENLRQAVRGLPIAYRQVVMLTLEGLGYKDISDVLGVSESNVGARLTRARRLLQDALEEQK